MKTNHLRKYIMLLLLTSMYLFVKGQGCNVEIFEASTIPAYPGNAPGFYTFSNASWNDYNCSEELSGAAVLEAQGGGFNGGHLLYTMTGGINGSQFEEGKEYSFSLNKGLVRGTIGTHFTNVKLSVYLSTGPECTTACQEIVSKELSLTEGECESWDEMSFTPNINFDYMLFIVTGDYGPNTSFPLNVYLDDICIQEVQECTPDFTYEQLDCGLFKFFDNSTGAVDWTWTISNRDGGTAIAGPSELEYEFDEPGTYFVQLSIFCEDGSRQRTEFIPINVDWDADPPFFENCESPLVFDIEAGIPCEVTFDPAEIVQGRDIGGGIETEVSIDGTTVTAREYTFTNPFTTVSIKITDGCGNTAVCDYEVILNCASASSDCTDFDDSDRGGWYRYNNLGGTITSTNVSIGAPGPTALSSDLFLYASDRPGSTFLVNETDYNGDWTEYVDQCLCFDYNVLDDGNASGTPLDARPYFILANSFDATQPIVWGVNPAKAVIWRSSTIVTENDGWNNFCIDVETCGSSGSLPVVAGGTWDVLGSPTDSCGAFNDVLGNVQTVMFGLDLTGSSTEIYGFDNICFGPCPQDQPDCPYDVTSTIIQEDDDLCCYEIEFDAQDSWTHVNFNLITPGVIFNSAVVDETQHTLNTSGLGTQLTVLPTSPGFGGAPAGMYPDLVKFCFGNVDLPVHTPQEVVVEYFRSGPNDGPVLACRDTLRFDCKPPVIQQDDCVEVEMDADCTDDPSEYKLTFSVTNTSGFTANQVVLTSHDPAIKFLPIGAPAGTIPQATIGVSVGSLADGATVGGLMVTVVTSSPIVSVTNVCFEASIWSGSMCCTSPDEYCVDLDVCCDPCENTSYDTKDISGTASGYSIVLNPIDDGTIVNTQVSGANTTGPTLESGFVNVASEIIRYDAFLNFDLKDVCPRGLITNAKLKLYADPATAGHNDPLDTNCWTLSRVIDAWDESNLFSVYPTSTSTNMQTVNSPSTTYQTYEFDVTALITDMINNPAQGHGFTIKTNCSHDHMLRWASRQHPNAALHPQLILEVDDSNCEEPVVLGDCCHSISIDNACVTDYFTAVEIVSNIPGVNIGSHFTGGAHVSEWNVTKSTHACVRWEHNSGHIPARNEADLINFCLDDIDAGETPQEIILNWYALSESGEEIIACADTLRYECDPPVDDDCLEIVDIQIKGDPCDTTDCYDDPWCNEWFVNIINLQPSLPLFVAAHTVEKAYWNGQAVYYFDLNHPGTADIGGHAIFSCDGTTIQQCEITIAGESCDPYAGIDPSTDLTDRMLLWSAGDPLPGPFDPSSCDTTSTSDDITACITIKNVSSHTATHFMINPITPGVTAFPSPYTLVPPLPSGSTTTVDVSLFGPAVVPGATLKFAVRLRDTVDPEDWCCFESDTLCITIPECDDCCEDIDVEATEKWYNDSINVYADECGACFYVPQRDSCDKITVQWTTDTGTLLWDMTSDTYCFGISDSGPVSWEVRIVRRDPETNEICYEHKVTGQLEVDCNNCCDNIDAKEIEKWYSDSINVYADECGACFYVPQRDSCDKITVQWTTDTGTLLWDMTSDTYCFGISDSGPVSWEVHIVRRDPETNEICYEDKFIGQLEVDCSDCCEDKDEFDRNIAQGFDVSYLGDCTYQFCLNQFDTCHWFNTASPVWGDGSVVLPVVTPSDPPNNCWTYTFPSGGPFTVSMTVNEGDTQDPCWSETIRTEITCPSEDPCEDVKFSVSSVTQDEDECCQTISIDNGFDANYFKGISVTVAAPVSISQIAAKPGWVLTSFGSYYGRLTPVGGGDIPLGTDDVFELCTEALGAGPHTITLSWLTTNDEGGLVEVCPEDIQIECEGGDDRKCFELVADSIHCETDTYCFKIKNISSPSFDLYSVNLYDLSGGLVVSPSGRIDIPGAPLVPGATSDWICVTYSGVSAGDNVCYKLSAHNTPVGTPPSQCCTDTLRACFTIPDCTPTNNICASCPDGRVYGSNLLVNGDFSAGNTGFASSYAYDAPLGMVTPGEYSVRNSTNLINGTWAATDHTSGIASGNFLVVDRNPGITDFWTQTVATTTGNTYSYCLWLNNLVDPSVFTDAGAPVVNVVIDGTVVTTVTVNQTPDNWISVSGLYTATSGSTTITLAFDGSSNGYTDLAVDDITFYSCEPIEEDCCDDLNRNEWYDYYDNNIVILNGDCESCVTVEADSCDAVFVDFLDGFGYRSLTDTLCKSFDGGGTYPLKVKVVRYDSNGEICAEEVFDRQFDIEGCGGDPCCDDLDRGDLGRRITDAFDNREVMDCKVCIPLELEECDYINVDWGDGTVWSTSGMTDTLPCHMYTASGTYNITVKLSRYDDDGDLCLEESETIRVTLDCPPPPQDNCVEIIDGRYDCETGNYCFKVKNLSSDPGFVMHSLTFVELTPGVFVSPDPYGLATPLNPGDTSDEICISVTGAADGDTVCLHIVAHQEDVSAGEEPVICCTDTIPTCFVIDCPPVDANCITMVEDSINCETGTYCIKVQNNTSGPAYTIRSIAFHDVTAGYEFTPDPVSIPPLAPGATSDWICVDYGVASIGDTICYTLVAHDQDIAVGEEPLFCCTNGVEYCVTIACDVKDPCCNKSQQEIDDLFAAGIDFTIDECVLTLPFAEDSCVIIDYLIQDALYTVTADTIEVNHSDNGTYPIYIKAYSLTAEGDTCWSIERQFEYEITNCTNGLCDPDDVNIYNALSPNGDGLNDVLVLESTTTCQKNIQVFNRWGQLVYAEQDYKNDWGGVSFSGELLAEGTYYIVVDLDDGAGGVARRKQAYIDIRK